MRKGQIIFFALSVLIAVLTVWFWLSVKNIADLYNTSLYIKPVLILISDLSFVFILLYLFEEFLSFAVLLLIPISFLAIFGWNSYFIGFAFAAVVASLLALRRSIGKKAEIIKLNFFTVARQFKELIAFSIIILFAGLIFFNILTIPQINFPKPLFDYSFSFTKSFVNIFAPGLNFDSSIDDFLAMRDLISGEAQINLNQLPVSLKNSASLGSLLKNGQIDFQSLFGESSESKQLNEELIKIVKANRKKQIETEREKFAVTFSLGNLKGSEPMKDVLYLIVNHYFNLLADRFSDYLPLAAAVSAFLLLKGFSWPVTFISLMLSWLILKIFKSFKLIKIEKVSAEKEVIVI